MSGFHFDVGLWRWSTSTESTDTKNLTLPTLEAIAAVSRLAETPLAPRRTPSSSFSHFPACAKTLRSFHPWKPVMLPPLDRLRETDGS